MVNGISMDKIRSGKRWMINERKTRASTVLPKMWLYERHLRRFLPPINMEMLGLRLRGSLGHGRHPDGGKNPRKICAYDGRIPIRSFRAPAYWIHLAYAT
jgi:hypothetical protein